MFGKKAKKNTETTENTNKGKVLTGMVVSNKMTDTVVVEVSNYTKHPKYQKFIKSRKKYKVHDAGNTLTVGDKVKIIETKPISKDKRFTLLEVISKSPTIDLEDEVTENKE